MTRSQLKSVLDQKALQYNCRDFISDDPVSVPHRFSEKQDVEISGLFAALFAWGNRKAIINSCQKLLGLMDNAPYDFVRHHSTKDLKPLLHFVHRTFNADDLIYFVTRLHYHYKEFSSLEDAFIPGQQYQQHNVKQALSHFHTYFLSMPHLRRTEKHIATPDRGSACKRLNMFLRWMVRKDKRGVDFGIWHKIHTSQLVCPLDLHVIRVAQRLGLLESGHSNWKNAVALTEALKVLCPEDPVRYDFALFGMGIASELS